MITLTIPTDPYALFVFIMYALGIICSFTLPWLPIVLWKWRVPKPARTLTAAHRLKKAPILVVHDSGRSEMDYIEERRGNGVVVTSRGKYKLLPRYVTRVRREAEKKEADTKKEENNGETEEATETATENPINPPAVNGKADGYLRDWSDWITKRSYLLGLNTPFFVGYSGKMCLLNPDALALFEAAKMKVRTEEAIKFNPKNLQNATIKDALEPLLLLEPREVKLIIESGFDETQMAAIATDSEMIGAAGRGLGKYKPLVALFVVLFFIGILIYFVPVLLGQG